ncbi:glycosyltransferase family 2 protein [Candidatus Microgenomates bacterium]|nr:glycosyltransferase family 2 protein [Candidatus Microgenomates bacterium]
MKLSIIIPVYNEEKTVSTVLEKVFRVKLPCRKEIIVVDDGSIDGTGNRIKNYACPPSAIAEGNCRRELRIKNLKIITHKKNQGKGAAVRTGIKAATGDYILIQDADLEYNPDEIPKLLSPVINQVSGIREQGSVGTAVYGSRFQSNSAVIPRLYLWGNKLLTFLTNLLYGTKLTDMETGYKLLPSSFLKKVHLVGNRFEIEPEITIKLIKAKIPIVEVPISYRSRSHLSGKKLTVRDAWGAVKTLLFNKFN